MADHRCGFFILDCYETIPLPLEHSNVILEVRGRAEVFAYLRIGVQPAFRAAVCKCE